DSAACRSCSRAQPTAGRRGASRRRFRKDTTTRRTEDGKARRSRLFPTAPCELPEALPGSSFRLSPTFPSISAGADGNVYVVWTNYLDGHGTVQLTRSTDGGETWSAPIAAGDVPGSSACFASVPAGPPPGQVAIVFHALTDVPADTEPG